MDIRDLTDFFGGSIFSEEYRGDFADIECFLQQLKTDSVHRSAEEKAWCAIVQGIFAILKGNMSEGYQFLDKLAYIPDFHPRWQVRYGCYMSLWHSLRRYPRVIRFSPELGGPAAALRDMEWKAHSYLEDAMSSSQNLANRLSLLEQHEALLIFFLWAISINLWTAAFPQHSRYPKGPIALTSEKIEARFAQRMEDILSFRSAALQMGMPEIAGFMDIMQLELTFAAGLPELPTLLRDKQSRYESAGNKHQLAISKVMEADDILSPPFSSPIALNLLVLDRSSLGSPSGSWEERKWS